MGLREYIEADSPKANAEFYEHPKRIAIDKWEPTAYIKLRAPNSRDSFSRQATEDDKLAYPEEWEQYQSGTSNDDGSTPLGQLPASKTAFELELRVAGIDTVELLAALEEPPEEYMSTMWKQAKMFVELDKISDE